MKKFLLVFGIIIPFYIVSSDYEYGYDISYDTEEHLVQKAAEIEQISPERITHLQDLSQRIPHLIAHIQQKVASSRELEEQLAPWQERLERVKQIAYALQDPAYAELASAKQFDAFYAMLNDFAGAIEQLNEQLKVAEFNLEVGDIRFVVGLTPGAGIQEVVSAYQEKVKEKLQKIEMLRQQSQAESVQPEIAVLQKEMLALKQAYEAFVQRGRAFQVIRSIASRLSQLDKQQFFSFFGDIEKLHAQRAATIKKQQEMADERARSEQLYQGYISDYFDGDYDWSAYEGFWND